MDQFLSEERLSHVVDALVRLVEAAGALIIFVGAMAAFVRFVIVGLRTRQPEKFVPVRLSLGRFLALGLEFQLAADILRTAIAPTLREIGELAAIAAIRTALNFFLSREIKEERAELARRRSDSDGSDAGPADRDEPAGLTARHRPGGQ
ncbi:MAG TPA: DUF1622 domain-containing protein [Catenuloplanes sp.]|jgi:uncharacterized membrane protein